MRKTALAALFAVVALAITANSNTVDAASLDLLKPQTNTQSNITSGFEPVILLANAKPTAQVEKPTIEPEVHQVESGQTLSSIAALHQTTWVRLYNKNPHISHPDVLNVGEKVVIPEPDEVIADRPLPEANAMPDVSQIAATASRPAQQSASVARGSSAGNTYAPGYCTWYVKNVRPDLPNNLGNADTWVARAAAQGLPTGSIPRVGAVGQQGMHVVYVERVNTDGTMFISEMNYNGLYVMSTRTANASDFRYIY